MPIVFGDGLKMTKLTFFTGFSFIQMNLFFKRFYREAEKKIGKRFGNIA